MLPEGPGTSRSRPASHGYGLADELGARRPRARPASTPRRAPRAAIGARPRVCASRQIADSAPNANLQRRFAIDRLGRHDPPPSHGSGQRAQHPPPRRASQWASASARALAAARGNCRLWALNHSAHTRRSSSAVPRSMLFRPRIRRREAVALPRHSHRTYRAATGCRVFGHVERVKPATVALRGGLGVAIRAPAVVMAKRRTPWRRSAIDDGLNSWLRSPRHARKLLSADTRCRLWCNAALYNARPRAARGEQAPPDRGRHQSYRPR